MSGPTQRTNRRRSDARPVPSRTPAKPVVVDGITWLGVIRPDHGHVTFGEAVKCLRDHGERFPREELEPAFFNQQDNGTFKLTRSSAKKAFVGWVLK